ncbi:hypothetical protein [Nitrososphaera viennensis]|uniref:Uncharacterized protein n=2 Tax=Nitrososphaera viennensis TaxID=1034015 RepID=A0A060HBX4_9ARCH|nr:hypothetical protein [Nitrososphaera viennensis]AIC14279.1 hypothetical protein NVIE_000980 [Nitrososphaera viennensis EN76]UVS69275.1 hypothetical protein NWT39_00460 [Nitrososphaera viennensis]
MSRTRQHAIAAVGGAAAAVFAMFVALAQTHVIAVPYFTPIALQVDGLKEKYAAGETANFAVTANGYGSNCHSLEVEAMQDGQRASYYKKVDDCRFMTITHGQYNFTRSFDYGSEVMGKAGAYTVDITFKDLVDNREAHVTKMFEVEG